MVRCPQVPQGDVMRRDGGCVHSGCTVAEEPRVRSLVHFVASRKQASPSFPGSKQSYIIILCFVSWHFVLDYIYLKIFELFVLTYLICKWPTTETVYIQCNLEYMAGCAETFRTHGRLPLPKEAVERKMLKLL